MARRKEMTVREEDTAKAPTIYVALVECWIRRALRHRGVGGE
jgi:hypothetical protein